MTWKDILKQNLQSVIDSKLAPELAFGGVLTVIVITDPQKYNNYNLGPSLIGGSKNKVVLKESSSEAQQMESLTNRPVEVGTYNGIRNRKNQRRDIIGNKVIGQFDKSYPKGGFKTYKFEVKGD